MKTRESLTTAIATGALALAALTLLAPSDAFARKSAAERLMEQGSFNYMRAAENSNAENVLVNWDNFKLADVYLRDRRLHWDRSEGMAARH